MRTTVHIQNLKCGGCERTIINKLSGLKHVSDVEVNTDEDSVSFNFHSKHDFDRAKHLLEMIGYPILGAENKLATKARSYISCVSGRIKK